MKPLLLCCLCALISGCASDGYIPVKVPWPPGVVLVPTAQPLVTYQGSTYAPGSLTIATPASVGVTVSIGGGQINSNQSIRDAATAVEILDLRRVTLAGMLATYAGTCSQADFEARLDSYENETEKIIQLALLLNSDDIIGVAEWNAKYTTQPVSPAQASTAAQQKAAVAAAPPTQTAVPAGIAATKATPISTPSGTVAVSVSSPDLSFSVQAPPKATSQ